MPKKNQYVVVRCRDAGCHAGFYVSRKGREVTLKNSRRIYYWSGACSLSQLALEGSKSSGECKISVVVPEITLTESCEIITAGKSGIEFFKSVTPWAK